MTKPTKSSATTGVAPATEVVMLDIDKIVVVYNPRKLFDAADLSNLISSIKQRGIRVPLVVEDAKDGTYILEDGERRYRSAKELGLKQVPVVIEEYKDDIERMINQWHLQEMHKNWTSIEKADLIGHLAEAKGVTIEQLSQELAISPRTAREYIAYYSLAERKMFAENEVPTTYAPYVIRVCNAARRLTRDVLEEEFSGEDRAALERRLIAGIKSGELNKSMDFTRVVDAFNGDPKTIAKFSNDKKSADKIYIESHAREQAIIRRVKQCSVVLSSAMRIASDMNILDSIRNDDAVLRELSKVKTALSKIIL